MDYSNNNFIAQSKCHYKILKFLGNVSDKPDILKIIIYGDGRISRLNSSSVTSRGQGSKSSVQSFVKNAKIRMVGCWLIKPIAIMEKLVNFRDP